MIPTMAEKNNKPFQIRPDEKLIERLRQLTIKFERESPNKLAVEILRDCAKIWEQAQQAKEDTLRRYAGPPSPVDDGQMFDMASYLVKHPYDTFYVTVSGDSMIEAGIHPGDILVVDRALEPNPSDIVVAQVGDGFTVKRFSLDQGRLRLVPANPNCKPIEFDEDSRICGVAVFAIRKL